MLLIMEKEFILKKLIKEIWNDLGLLDRLFIIFILICFAIALFCIPKGIDRFHFESQTNLSIWKEIKQLKIKITELERRKEMAHYD